MAINAEKLNRLAQLFAPYAPLYEVGGYVRDSLLGRECADLDICSELTIGSVKELLEHTEFAVSDKSMRMGTVHISADDFCAEYTTFRTESYDRGSGAHAPKEVRFTSDIAADARRRDFSCNAVYVDIMSGETVDPTGGVNDIKRGILRTANEPDEVFEADGLRILRLVRFACELGFEVDGDTYEAARRNAWRVKDISPERIRDELSKIFVADSSNKAGGERGDKAHVRGIRMLDELGVEDMLLPELAELKGLAQPKKYHMYDAYEHSIKAYEVSPPEIRWAALLHDVGKRRAYEMNGGANMHGHDEIGAKTVREILDRLRFPNAERDRTVRLVRLHMTDLKGDMSWHKLRRFAVENADIMDELCALKDADAFASCGRMPERNRLREAWEEIRTDGTPLGVKDLKVNGNDLRKLGFEDRQIGEVLGELFNETVLNPSLNDRQKAMNYVTKKSENLRKVEK